MAFTNSGREQVNYGYIRGSACCRLRRSTAIGPIADCRLDPIGDIHDPIVELAP